MFTLFVPVGTTNVTRHSPDALTSSARRTVPPDAKARHADTRNQAIRGMKRIGTFYRRLAGAARPNIDSWTELRRASRAAAKRLPEGDSRRATIRPGCTE